MKRIFTYILVFLAAATVGSCSLDKYPDTSINSEEAMQSPSDCYNFLVGLYSSTKSIYSGVYSYATDFMTDDYHAIKNFGNWDGEFFHYDITASSSTVATVWDNYYHYIGNANFLIAGAKKLIDGGTLSASDLASVQEYYGEACFLRAMMYFNLTQYFCNDYDKSSAETTLGVPVVTTYAPTGDQSKYPHRGSLKADYDQIVADLVEAGKYVTRAGAQNSGYVTKDCITALYARVALTMEDYSTAYDKANALITAGTYPVMTDAAAYASGWKNDDLKETIWQPLIVDNSDGGSACSYFEHNTTGTPGDDDPQYLPEDWVLALYDKTNDIRYDAYFAERAINKRGNNGNLTLLIKFPGNPKLNPSTASRYINMPKVFRISEMYLIAAEAEANIVGKEQIASDILNELRSYRIKGWTKTDYSGTALMSEIRDERTRELFGEGFRLNDLKRWHMGFTRSAGQDPDMLMPGNYYISLTMPADSPLFVWPIPTSEISANPQMKNEQNPGYTLK